MSFIPEDQREQEGETPETTAEKPSPDKKEDSSLGRSLILLAVISVALFFARDYLTGSKAIPGISEYLTEVKPKEAKEAVGELRVPRMSDREMRDMLAEFKSSYEDLYPSEVLLKIQPEIKIARFSEDRNQFLIELQAIHPDTGKVVSEDVIFERDPFGRMVTSGDYANIKLDPKE